MENVITDRLFSSVEQAVRRVCVRAQSDSNLIITEGDLQSRIFAELVGDERIIESGAHVHTQINYLKRNGKLGLVPDIVLLAPNAYSVDEDGALHERKGYTVWGSSIAIELKLLRAHRKDDFIKSVTEDIKKLKGIRDQHYQNYLEYQFFAASVVFCRQPLSSVDEEILRMSAERLDIPLWLFNCV